MAPGASAEEVDHVVARMQEAGVDARVSAGREATVIAATGDRELLATLPLEGYPGVEQVLPILKPYKLVAREVSADPTVIDVEGRRVGDTWFGLIAGPCTVETREQTLETARRRRRCRRHVAPRRRRSSRARRPTRSRASAATRSRSSARRASRPACRS